MYRYTLFCFILCTVLLASVAGCTVGVQQPVPQPPVNTQQPAAQPTLAPTKAPAPAAQPTSAPTQVTVLRTHIIGKVTKALAPVPGARVELRKANQKDLVDQVTAGPDGSYAFTNPPDGDYVLFVVWPDAGQPQTSVPLHIPQGGISEFVVPLEQNMQLVGPATNAELDVAPTLRWTSVPGAVRYQVSVSDAGTTEMAMQPTETTATNVQVTPEIKRGRTYDWSVNAIDAKGIRVAWVLGRFMLKGDTAMPAPTAAPALLEGVPPECQVRGPNTKAYIIRKDDYCFMYPARFELGNTSNGQPNVWGPALDKSLDPARASLTVEVKPSNGKSLDSLVDEALKEFVGMTGIPPIKRTRVQFGADQAIVAEPVPGRLSSRVVFIVYNDKLYRLAFWPMDIPQAKPDLDELYNVVMSSFSHLIK